MIKKYNGKSYMGQIPTELYNAFPDGVKTAIPLGTGAGT
jgi:hypothetical protein